MTVERANTGRTSRLALIGCAEFARVAARRATLVLGLAAAAAACGRDGGDVLHVYTSLDAQEAPAYLDAFERETGVRVRWVRLSAGEALARLEAERANPRVSVWFGGPSPEYIVAAQRGLLEPYTPKRDDALPARADSAGHTLDPRADSDTRALRADTAAKPRPPDAAGDLDGDAWTGFYFGAIGFACDERFLRVHDVACPDTWEALLDPAFRGRVSVAYPYTSGTAYVVVAALLEHYGEARGWDYIRALDVQVGRYNSSGTAAVQQVGLGEAAVGIAFAHDILSKGIARGYPMVLSVPRDGTATEIGAAAIVRGGPTPALAARFIDWLVTARAQDLLAEFHRVPLHPAARVAEGAVTPDAIRAIPVDPVRAAARQREILAEWRRVTGR
jgi:iron(III) transport system substrate-binding protein